MGDGAWWGICRHITRNQNRAVRRSNNVNRSRNYNVSVCEQELFGRLEMLRRVHSADLATRIRGFLRLVALPAFTAVLRLRVGKKEGHAVAGSEREHASEEQSQDHPAATHTPNVRSKFLIVNARADLAHEVRCHRISSSRGSARTSRGTILRTASWLAQSLAWALRGRQRFRVRLSNELLRPECCVRAWP